ncbi:MAG: flagellar basal body-associated FliL family protein [Vicinamibacterales bacterium]
MEEPQLTPVAAPAPAPRVKGGLVKKLAAVTVLLIVAAGGAAWWWMGGTAHAAAEEPALEERGVLPFQPFLVNLADDGGNRFLKTNIELVLASAEEAKHVEETPVLVSHLRSAILEILTQQSAAALVTPQGKDALRKAIKDRATPLLPHQKVMDVLFSEFVVQF